MTEYEERAEVCHEEQVQAGKDWIVETLWRLAAEEKVPLERLEWQEKRSREDVDRDLHPLFIYLPGQRIVERFKEDFDLADCGAGDENVRTRLGTRLRAVVRSLRLAKG